MTCDECFFLFFLYQIKTTKLSISSINVPDLLFIVEELKAEDDKQREAVSHYIFVRNTCIKYTISDRQ